MTSWQFDPGSFRDRKARVILEKNRILRAVFESGASTYREAREENIYKELAHQGLLLQVQEIDPRNVMVPDGTSYLLETPKLPFISYPYEWIFSLHQRAALLHLDLHLAALELDFTLLDATAYNVQFEGTRPIFIDHMSLRKYEPGEVWVGHRQFCMQFLNPLLFWSHLGLSPNAWFRGSLEGITPEVARRLLPWKSKLSFTVATHVVAQSVLQTASLKNKKKTSSSLAGARLPKKSLIGMLRGLREYIAKLSPPKDKTVWEDYGTSNSYTQCELAEKKAFVDQMVRSVKPRLLFDLGCNTGNFSEIALEAGAGSVVGFDFDHGALELAYRRFDAKGSRFLPLMLDASNPSPSQGWAQSERKGLKERAEAEALIALALIHHIAIGKNVPLADAVNWIIDLAPIGVIEFPHKSDPMVQHLLAHREDIFEDYCEQAFLEAVNARARVVQSARVSDNGRLLVWYDRT